MSPERLAAYRKTFGRMSTEELRAIAEGRKATKLAEEAIAAIRLVLAERNRGGRQDLVFFKTRATGEMPGSAASQLDESGEIQIRCGQCRKSFAPDMSSKNAHWPCPHCRAKNQNLKRHYRSIAVLCVLNLIGVAIWIFSSGKAWEIVLAVADAILLFLTAVAIYNSKAPWADATAKALIRVVFYSAFLFNVVVPLLWGVSVGKSGAIAFAVLPYVIVYAVVFPYLFWLESVTRKCTVPRSHRDLYLYTASSQAAPLKPNLVAATASSATDHPVMRRSVRWTFASLAVILLLSIAWMVFSGRSSPPRPAESRAETLDTPSRITQDDQAVPSPDYDTGQFAVEARNQEQNVGRAGLPRRSPVPQRTARPPLDNKPQATVELIGVIGIPGMTKAMLEITEPGFGRTLKNVTVKEGDRVDSIEVLQVNVAKGQVRIRNSGAESVLTLRTPRLGAVAANAQVASQQASFATPPGNWPQFFGDLNGDLELRIRNPNEFSVRVGLRSGSRGKDFTVPAYGTQSVSVPGGHYTTCFQYSSEPGGMYQGDSFTLQNNGAQITITRVVNGNYAIRKVN